MFSISRYPKEILTNQGAQFTSKLIENIMQQHRIHHRKSTHYHPRANGKEKVTNIELESILTKTINMKKMD
jgi:hypothetical protein